MKDSKHDIRAEKYFEVSVDLIPRGIYNVTKRLEEERDNILNSIVDDVEDVRDTVALMCVVWASDNDEDLSYRGFRAKAAMDQLRAISQKLKRLKREADLFILLANKNGASYPVMLTSEQAEEYGL